SCHDDANGTITASGSGGTGALSYSIGGAFQASGSFTGLAAGSYTVTVKDANGCTKTQPVTISNPPAVTLSLDQVDPPCDGAATGGTVATGRGGTGARAYSKDGATYSTSGTFDNLAAGNYTIWVKDATGCKTSKSVTIVNPPAITVSANATSPGCNGI